jgi:hypothetical protein
MGVGDDNQLMKVAVFCISLSVISTCLIMVFVAGTGDYDYDAMQAYRNELTEFSGGTLVNDTPWVLTGVYTPFVPGSVPDDEIVNHIEYDNGKATGWLYGSKITDYPDLNKAADISLDVNQKSNQLLTVGNPEYWEFVGERTAFAGNNEWGVDLSWLGIAGFRATKALTFGQVDLESEDPYWQYETVSGAANNWNYTGYRYVFDPTLPFSSETSTKDGRLSLVWYETSRDTGLSGALEVYAANDKEQVLLASISAVDIISAFQTSNGYVSTVDFNFEGTHLNLTIRFSPTVYTKYTSLQDAWDEGAWTMAISSASAGNFFDVENSNAFNVTAGSAFDTFIDIFTFQMPEFKDTPWANVVIWLLVGLPMSLGMLCVTMRLVGGVFKIF